MFVDNHASALGYFLRTIITQDFLSEYFYLNEAILSAAIRHSSGGWNPGGEPNNLDTGLRRYDVRRFIK